MSSNSYFKGKSVVITGGTGVLGSAMAVGLANQGAQVAALGKDPENIDHLTKETYTDQGSIMAMEVNVLDEQNMAQASQKVLSAIGGVDILINAAGGNMPGATITPEQSITDLSVDSLKKVVELNYFGTVIPNQAFLPKMIAQGHGNIIHISSMAAQRPLTRVMGYASSKAAIDNYTKWLAVELAQKHGEGFRVNAIAPGFFLTVQNKTLLTNEDGSYTDRAKTILSQTPYKRFGQPEELIGTLLWLCSDASKFVTGAVIPVDGGYSAFGGI